MNRLLFIILFFSIVFCSCNDEKNEVVYSSGVTVKALLSQKNLYNIDADNLEKAIQLGFFFPEDSNCKKKILVQPALNFDWVDFETDLSHVPDIAIKKVLATAYRIFGDPVIVQEESYNYFSPPLSWVIDSVKLGKWAPQCGGIANITNRIFAEFSNEISASSIHIDNPVHTLNILTFEISDITYKVAFDAQNGFLFPVYIENQAFVALNDIDSASTNYSFFWLPDSVLNQKRNLLQVIPPCNFMPFENGTIYHTQKNSPYKFEATSQSFHKILWFDKAQTDTLLLKKEIVKKILEKQSL